LLLLVVGCKKAGDDPPGGGTRADSSAAAAAASGSVALPVVGQPVRKGDLVLSVVTTGQVRSDGVAMLKSETVGPITAVPARPGQSVKKGQVIVQVDPRELDLAVDQAQAALEDAKLKLLDNIVPDSIVSDKPVTGERLRSAEIRAGLDRAK